MHVSHASRSLTLVATLALMTGAAQAADLVGGTLTVTGASSLNQTTINGILSLKGVGTSIVQTTDASGLYLDAKSNGGMYLQSDGNFYFRKSSTPYTEMMRIDSSGNIGIGIITPTQKLHVCSNANTYINVDAPAGGYAGINLQTSGTTNCGIYRIPSNTGMEFRTNGLNRMRINTNGDVGIVGSLTTNLATVTGASSLNQTVVSGSLASDYLFKVNNTNTTGLGIRSQVGVDSNSALSVRNAAGTALTFDVKGNGSVTAAGNGIFGGSLSVRCTSPGNVGGGFDNLSPTGFGLGVQGGGGASNLYIANFADYTGKTVLGVTLQAPTSAALNEVRIGGGQVWANDAVMASNGTIRSGFVNGASFAKMGSFTNHNLALATNNINRVTITAAGNVGIGTANPTCALTVNGLILAKEIKTTVDNLADYVFSKDYNLRSLDDVESAIKKDSRLPGMPSAKQVAEEGMYVSDMMNKQLEKIEELTLYAIDAHKKNEALASENAELKRRMDAIEKALGLGEKK